MPGRSGNLIQDSIVAARRARVAEKVLQKIEPAVIARQLDISVRKVWDDIARIREMWREAAVGDLSPRIGEQLATLDQLKKTLQELLKNESKTDPLLRVIDRLIDVMEREAKLLGLNAPDELRLDASTLNEVVALVMRAVLPHVVDPAARVALADEVDSIRGRYVAGKWSQAPESNSSAG
jgi:hypothetical protein